MFGNRLGWIVSGGLLVVFACLLNIVYQSSQPDAPTKIGLAASTYTLDLAVGPETLVPNYMTEPGDAGSLYRQVVAEYADNYQTVYYPYLSSPIDEAGAGKSKKPSKPGVDVGRLKVVGLLTAAAKLKDASIFAPDAQTLLRPEANRQAITDLSHAAGIALRLGSAHQYHQRYAEAKKCYEIAFVAGVQMWRERLLWAEAREGTGLMGSAAMALKSLAEDQHDAAAIEKYSAFLTARDSLYSTKIDVVQKALTKLNNLETGDMIAIAKNGGDRVWKIEATMALGRIRFNSDRPGNQIGSLRALNQLSQSPDPILHIAATAARDMTVEQFRSIRTSLLEER